MAIMLPHNHPWYKVRREKAMKRDIDKLTMGHFHCPKRPAWYVRFWHALLGRLGFATGGFIANGSILGHSLQDFETYSRVPLPKDGQIGPIAFTFPNRPIYPPGPLHFDCAPDGEFNDEEPEDEFEDGRDALFIPAPDEKNRLNVARDHYEVEVFGRKVCVTGAWIGREPDVGIMSSYFEPHAIYHRDGLRLTALENALTDREWSGIGEQVDAEAGE